MNTTGLTDAGAATAALNAARDNLAPANDDATKATAYLRDAIVDIRTRGLLTVDEMAEAVRHDRNYIDSVWSSHGGTVKGKQTRVAVAEDADPEKARYAYETLFDAASRQDRANDRRNGFRQDRDKLVAAVYASKLLGPTAIAAAVGVDRNHVLRIARKAGVGPQHRRRIRNQYSSK